MAANPYGFQSSDGTDNLNSFLYHGAGHQQQQQQDLLHHQFPDHLKDNNNQQTTHNNNSNNNNNNNNKNPIYQYPSLKDPSASLSPYQFFSPAFQPNYHHPHHHHHQRFSHFGNVMSPGGFFSSPYAFYERMHEMEAKIPLEYARVWLDHQTLWRRFSVCGNEMIITKMGRYVKLFV